MTEDSIFTKIIKGELPAAKVYEDEDVIAFMALHAVNPGHILVVPKEQVDHFHHLSDELMAKVMKVGKKVAEALEKTYDAGRVGMSVIGFEVPHAHLHVMPIDDIHDITFKKALDGTLGPCSGDELEVEAAKIRGNL